MDSIINRVGGQGEAGELHNYSVFIGWLMGIGLRMETNWVGDFIMEEENQKERFISDGKEMLGI